MTKIKDYVSKEFVSAVYSSQYKDVLAGEIMFSDHGDGKGLQLMKWDIAASIPTDAEVAAVISAIEAEAPAIARKAAYLRESDALVIRAMRLQMAGDPGADAAKNEALAKVAEIKVRIPDLEVK